MSHINPTYDPADFDELTPEKQEELVAKAELAMEAQMEDDFIRQHDIYEVTRLIKHMRNDDLKEVVNGLPEFDKHRLSLYLTH